MLEELRAGSTGEAVRDLQVRLSHAGLATHPDRTGDFGPGTQDAVRQFQERRGLRVDGVVRDETWSALVESGYALGDRLLYLRQPMLRGDDVGALQRRLNALGFDAGREDGIFGEQTHRAVREFQRNAGITLDGVCGPATILELSRVQSMAAGAVASVREREALRTRTPGLAGRTIFLTVAPGFDVMGDELAAALREAGARVLLERSGEDDSALAAAANRGAVDLCLTVRAGETGPWHCAYFGTAGFRSEAGLRLARSIAACVAPVWTDAPGFGPKAYAILRETRMPAVVVEPVGEADVSGMRQLLERLPEIAAAVARGVRDAFEPPVDGSDDPSGDPG